jgi:NADH-quinone oxidoreductase subunit L
MLRYIIFAPLLGATINWLVGRRVKNELFISLVGCLSVAISTLIAFYLAFKPDGALTSTAPVTDYLWTWIEVGRFRADMGLAMDRLSGIYTLFITFVGLLIHIFSTGYMKGESGYYRFFAYLNLFMFSMLTLVLADNLLLMFVGWEGVGLCSYLLIGYYFDRPEAAHAAKKAFVANRIGDWGVVLGIFLVFSITGSISFFGANNFLQAVSHMAAEPFTWGALVAGGLTSAAILLFIGATGKSAQIPLYVWLPDAMAGPTPVSALIHAATMVTAGVYLIVRCSALFINAPTAMFVIAIIGAATAIIAATIGIAQNDIKKVLAYSTVSQLGYMMLACGVGAFVAAIFHVMTHAFFKALLFLGSGSVIHGMHHEQDMRNMGGLKKYMPITYLTMLTGWLAICGIPIFAGFFSKDEILWRTWSTHANPYGKVFWAIGALTALITAFYMTRLMVMTFWGELRSSGDSHHGSHGHGHGGHHGAHKPHESPLVMTVPLIILAVLSTVGGLVGIPHALSFGAVPNYFEKTLEPVLAHKAKAEQELQWLTPPPQHTDGAPAVSELGEHGTAAEHAAAGGHHDPAETRMEQLFSGLSVLIAVVGIFLGWTIFSKKPLLKMPALLENKYYLDEIYDKLVITPLKVISRDGLWKIFDVKVIDGIVNGTGKLVTNFGQAVRYLQPGFVRSYAAIILLGALAIIAYFAYYFAFYTVPAVQALVR